MDYTYTLEKDRKTGYVRILFAESAKWQGELPSPFLAAEIFFGHTFPCYVMPYYLTDIEQFLERGFSTAAPLVDVCLITPLRICDHIGFCTGDWWSHMEHKVRMPEDCVFSEGDAFVACEGMISFFSKDILLDILRNYRRACEECCEEHLRWLKSRKYHYTVYFDYDWHHAGVKPLDKKDIPLRWITSERESFRMVPVEQMDRNSFRYFACLFRNDWVIYGFLCEDGCHRFHCLPKKVFQKIARELNHMEAEHSASPHEKRLKKQWRQIQLSGKMWPMP